MKQIIKLNETTNEKSKSTKSDIIVKPRNTIRKNKDTVTETNSKFDTVKIDND